MTDRYREGFDAALDAVLAEDAALYYTDLPLLTAHEAVRRVRSRPLAAPPYTDDGWAMREAITRALSAWDSTADVGGPPESEALRTMATLLDPYRIEATTNAASGEAEPNSETDRPGVSP